MDNTPLEKTDFDKIHIMGKGLVANLIGASGLVGKQLVKMLLEDNRFSLIRIFMRRDLNIFHPKLEQHIVDFGNENLWENLLNGDILFSSLGTTLKQAGSKDKEYEVDYMFNLNFAKRAKEKGFRNYILVSSIGANAKSPFFYPRMKGELEEAVSQLGFEKLAIIRPSFLVGKREIQRLMERASIPLMRIVTSFIFKKYKPIEASVVAMAMINAAFIPQPEKTIWENDEIFKLAEN